MDFSAYLRFVIEAYATQRHHFVTTDGVLRLQVRTVSRRDRNEAEEVKESQECEEQFPVLEGLRRYALGEGREHVLLAGRPGSGKSMALRQLVVQLAEEGLVPVLVQLKRNAPILKAIADELENGDLEFDESEIKRLLRHQKLILLLDGINEANDSLRRELEGFRSKYSQTSMIFTTRDLAIGGDLGIEKQIEMKPLSQEQLREFVGKYLPEQGEKLLGQLGDRLREIAETPLLLKMLCDVFKQTGEIPQNKGELFQRFDAEYERFKGLPAVSEDFRRFKSEVLQHLAYTMMLGDGGVDFELTIGRRDAERAIEALLKGRVDAPGARAKEWLEDLVEHHLLQVAADAGRVEFHHQLFQEYYAAEWLLGRVRGMDAETLECEFLNLLKWTETVGLMLGLVEDEELAVRVVEKALGVDLMLGARLAGTARIECQEKSLNLIEKLTNENSLIVFLLGVTKSSLAIPILQKIKNHSTSEVDQINATTIYKRIISGTMDQLIEWLRQEDPRLPRYLETLSRVKSEVSDDDMGEYLTTTLYASRKYAFQHSAEANIYALQYVLKFYNYEIYQKAQTRHPPAKQQPLSGSTIVYGDYIKIVGNKYENPNATEVKIFENVQNYHPSPPRDPPP